MQGRVATTANQIIFCFRAWKRRLGMSIIAQKVGAIGIAKISARIRIFKGMVTLP